jgi:hypothetical protein
VYDGAKTVCVAKETHIKPIDATREAIKDFLMKRIMN